MQHDKKLHDIRDQNNNILDISSGFLYLAGDSLVPESINKNFLEEAIVLQQVDKKFIPIVACRTLAVVDQVCLFNICTFCWIFSSLNKRTLNVFIVAQ